MFEQLKEIILNYVEVDADTITEDSRFIEDLGFNSYDFMSLLGELEQEFDITVDENQVTKDPEIIEIEVNNHNAVKEFEVFADAILNGKDVLTDAREGAKTVAVCLAIVESAKTGEKVKPDYNF